MLRRFAPLVLGVAALLATDLVPAAGVSQTEKCAVNKRKAAGKKVRAKMACVATAKAEGTTVDPGCLAKAEAKFNGAMAKAGACLGNPAAVESQVDDCVAILVGDVPGDGQCPSRSAKAVGTAAKCEIDCGAKEITKPGSFGACHANCDARLDAALAKAGACGQSATTQTDVDECRNTILPPIVSATTTSTTSSTVP